VGEIRMKREKQAKLNTIKLKKDAIWSHKDDKQPLQHRTELIFVAFRSHFHLSLIFFCISKYFSETLCLPTWLPVLQYTFTLRNRVWLTLPLCWTGRIRKGDEHFLRLSKKRRTV
jgi:hypothetical protein